MIATIKWVPEQKTYQIKCLSKNGMVVSGCYHAKGGVGEVKRKAAVSEPKLLRGAVLSWGARSGVAAQPA